MWSFMIDLFCAQAVVFKKYAMWPKKQIDIDNAGDITEEDYRLWGCLK